MATLHRTEKGFTLVELMVVVLIIGILIAIAVPLYESTKAKAAQRACFANQRTIEGAVRTWSAAHGADTSPLEGVVDKDHPLLGEYVMNPVPRCPSAPKPAVRSNPSVAEGAYTLLASGELTPCGIKSHGHY